MRELEEGIETQFERHNRPDTRGPHGIADGDELCFVESRRLFEHQVLACLGCGDSLRGMEMVWRGNRDDVDVRRLEHVFVARRQPGIESQLMFLEGCPSPRFVPAVEQDHAHMGILLKRNNMLGRTPANAGDGDTQFSITSWHRLSLD
jgi:hypothetical protein